MARVPSAALWEADSISAAEADTPLSADSTLEARTGTEAQFVKPILEKNGLQAGKDFYLAFSPERVDPGNETWHVRNTPKVVGGFTSECVRRSALLLASLMENPNLVHSVGSPAVAEMAKLLENTYRAVNIALVNELAQMCHKMDIDVWEVIDAAATKPFGFQPFYPGIGPGGHCIPVDPHYLAWKAREYEFQLRFVELAADVNTQMAEYAVSRLQDLLNNESKSLRGSNILCFGAAFKPGVSDCNYLCINCWIIQTDRFNPNLIELAIASCLWAFCAKELT